RGPIQHNRGLIEPGRTLLGQRAGFMLGVTGLQRCPLRQVQRFDRCRWPTMITLEPDREFAAADVDEGTPARPTLVQSGVYANDLPDRPLRWGGAARFGKPHP